MTPTVVIVIGTSTYTQTPGMAASPATQTPAGQPALPGGSYFYPSPSRGDTGAIAYELGQAGDVTIKIHNQTGRLVDTLQESRQAGRHSTPVDVSRFAAGTYYYLLTVHNASGATETQAPRKFVVLH
jgi:hypothetical protein